MVPILTALGSGKFTRERAIASEHLYPQSEVIASELNRLGFPGFRGGKWDKQKIKRQLDKLRGKIKTVEVKAQAIA